MDPLAEKAYSSSSLNEAGNPQMIEDSIIIQVTNWKIDNPGYLLGPSYTGSTTDTTVHKNDEKKYSKIGGMYHLIFNRFYMRKKYLIILLFINFACQNNDVMKSYYENGNIKEKCEVINNIRNGACTLFFENGNISAITHWQNDSLNGMAYGYYLSGSLKYEASWNNGSLHGYTREYFENGNIHKKGRWSFGERVGFHNEFYLNGQLKSFTNYLEFDKGSHLNEVIILSEQGDTLYDKSNFFRLSFCCDTLNIGDTLVAEFNVVAPHFQNSKFYFYFDIPENINQLRKMFSENGSLVYDYIPVFSGQNYISGYIEEFMIKSEKNDTISGQSRYLYFDFPYWVKEKDE